MMEAGGTDPMKQPASGTGKGARVYERPARRGTKSTLLLLGLVLVIALLLFYIL